jgi:hypothetical protein
MDLRGYYRKLREIEQGLQDEYVVVRSLATADGGIAGRLTEVARGVAARMATDGLAEVAGPDEAEAFRREWAEQKKREDQKRTAAQINFTVLSEADMRTLRKTAKE